MTPETEAERNEAVWLLGYRAAKQAQLADALQWLGYSGQSVEALASEREAAVRALRAVCADHGDNDWPDNLHLADVIEKHLHRHLTENTE
jgi:hypothetical protein